MATPDILPWVSATPSTTEIVQDQGEKGCSSPDAVTVAHLERSPPSHRLHRPTGQPGKEDAQKAYRVVHVSDAANDDAPAASVSSASASLPKVPSAVRFVTGDVRDVRTIPSRSQMLAAQQAHLGPQVTSSAFLVEQQRRCAAPPRMRRPSTDEAEQQQASATPYAQHRLSSPNQGRIALEDVAVDDFDDFAELS